MNVVVTGATGFLGRAVVERMVVRGDTVTAFTRNVAGAKRVLPAGAGVVAWEPSQARGEWEASVAAADAVVNLAGEPVMGHRWNDAVKRAIHDSRVLGTRHLVEAIERAARRPAVFVCASATGYYGDTGETIATEETAPGNDFLASVCVAWEREAERVAAFGVREVRLRIAVVLGEGGGALAEMVTPFKLFAGGPIGSGRQWLAWIAHEDAVRVVLAAVDDARYAGAFNACAPEPVRMGDLAKAIGRAMHRPSWAAVPAVALRVALGEAASVLLDSKRVVPARLQRAGFEWAQPVLGEALASALRGAARV